MNFEGIARFIVSDWLNGSKGKHTLKLCFVNGAFKKHFKIGRIGILSPVSQNALKIKQCNCAKRLLRWRVPLNPMSVCPSVRACVRASVYIFREFCHAAFDAATSLLGARQRW